MSESWRSVESELPALRRAVDANVFKGGKSVIARSSKTTPHFRIVGVKYRRGVVYGLLLNSKWTVITEWETC